MRVAAQDLVASNPASAVAMDTAVAVSSSRSASVRVEAVGGHSRAGSSTFEVKVTNLAVAQVNAGAALTSTATNAFGIGENQFTIKTVSGPTKTVRFMNDTTDTNKEALEGLVDAINEAEAGVTASLDENADAGTVQLVLTADETGLGHSFEVADVTGSVVGTSGVGSATVAAERAAFMVNGISRASDSNLVEIDGGRVELTLQAETGPNGDDDERGTIVAVGSDALAGAVLELVSSLNSLQHFVLADSSSRSLRIERAFLNLLQDRKGDLEGLGIDVGPGGDLKVDLGILETAINERRAALDEVLGGAEGVATQIARVADRALGSAVVQSLQNARTGPNTALQGSSFLSSAPASHRGLLVDIIG